jgi:hypothetical protein
MCDRSSRRESEKITCLYITVPGQKEKQYVQLSDKAQNQALDNKTAVGFCVMNAVARYTEFEIRALVLPTDRMAKMLVDIQPH